MTRSVPGVDDILDLLDRPVYRLAFGQAGKRGAEAIGRGPSVGLFKGKIAHVQHDVPSGRDVPEGHPQRGGWRT
jgi:hypothetical protein